MDIIFIISLIIFVFLAALTVIFVKKILKIIFFILIISLVFILAFGFFIYKDMSNIKEKFTNSGNILLLIDDDKISTGVIINKDETDFISQEQLNSYSNYLINKDYESILGDNYKLMLVKLDILNELDENYIISDKKISRERLIEILRSEEPSKELTKESITIGDSDKIKIKAALFSATIANNLVRGNPFKMLIYY